MIALRRSVLISSKPMYQGLSKSRPASGWEVVGIGGSVAGLRRDGWVAGEWLSGVGGPLVPALLAVTVAVHLQDVNVVGEPIEQGSGAECQWSRNGSSSRAKKIGRAHV